VTGRERLRAVHGPAEDDAAETAARVAWSIVAEPGDGVAGALVAELGAARSLRLVLAAGSGITPELRDAAAELAPDDPDAFVQRVGSGLERWAPRLGTLDVGRTLDTAAAVNARLLIPGDPCWPESLGDLGVHAPFVLWARMRSAIPLGASSLAVVGSRANTTYGTEVAADVTAAAVRAGLHVVSGGAYGIDAVAHRVALGLGGTTVAILAGGVDQFYPAGNAELLRSASTSGAVIAESPPGVRPTRWRFLARNRLIAALAAATVVVEAGARSGALNTAHHAASLGRPVFAVPGPVTAASSVGCHRLVASGRADILVRPSDPVDAVVRPATLGDDVLTLGGTNDDEELIRALDALDRRAAVPILDVARRSGLSMTAAADALALAELQGRVIRSPDGWRRP
jgi:DNA processing protein